ncbi:protein GET1 [Andrographis paniculata]|uniref:protein GET1 n=1 Tax=Andrographis paniculata TaxID=175694 RepID=UPI0021E72FB5|nr:protein GET1 [Andrographis paniculata]
MEEEKSMAAPAIFVLVFSFQYAALYVESYTKKKLSGGVEARLREEINQLLKEAGSLTQPSTFAQAAKLRRMAASKEKELAKFQEMNEKYIKASYNKYGRPLLILKVLTYVSIIMLFWRSPVAMISKQLVQPLGKLLSWRSGGSVDGNVMVGIIPWLIISTRVSKYVCRKVFDVSIY